METSNFLFSTLDFVSHSCCYFLARMALLSCNVLNEVEDVELTGSLAWGSSSSNSLCRGDGKFDLSQGFLSTDYNIIHHYTRSSSKGT